MAEYQYLGAFPVELPVSSEHLTIVFSASTLSLTQRWKNKNLSADFLADYFANFFPGEENAPLQTTSQAEIRSAIGFVANELLENALKFNHDPAYNMSIQLHLYHDALLLLSTNSMDPTTVTELEEYYTELLAGDPGDMYVRQLEKNAEEETASSRMGFLTMLNDYGATLGWRFERILYGDGASPLVILTTLVNIAV